MPLLLVLPATPPPPPPTPAEALAFAVDNTVGRIVVTFVTLNAGCS